MAKMAFGDFKGKAARSHEDSLVSLGTLILWEASYQLHCDLLGAEPHGSKCDCVQPQQVPRAPDPDNSESPQKPVPVGFSDDPPQILLHFICA
jgi:hypothetical protein